MESSAGQTYVVREGDTLRAIAQAFWGDASLWYVIASANGLSGAEALAAGTRLRIPADVVNVHNKSSTYRVYDSTDTLGNLQPIPKGAKNKQACGGAGQIVVALVAAAVAFWITKSFQLAGKILSAFGTTAAAASPLAVAAANAAAGAIAGAAGSIAGQGVGVLTGVQDRIDWRGVGMSAISGAVSGYMGPTQSGGFIAGLERGVTSNVVTQTIGVAVGLQKKFDWAGVAAAGLQGGVSNLVANSSWLANNVQATANPLSPSSLLNAAIPGVAGAVASAAAQSALTRTDFGDNLRALLPEVIGSTIGNALAARAVMGGTAAASAAGSDAGPVTTPGDIYADQLSRLGLDPNRPAPDVRIVENLRTEHGRRANGRYTPGYGPDDPGTIALDARLVRRAAYSKTAAAQLYAALAEEYGAAAANQASEVLMSSRGGIDTGAALGGLETLSALSGLDRSDTLKFSLGKQVFSTDRRILSSAFVRTFTLDRLAANVEDAAGSYQVSGRGSRRSSGGGVTPDQKSTAAFNPAKPYFNRATGTWWANDREIPVAGPTRDPRDGPTLLEFLNRPEIQTSSTIGAIMGFGARNRGARDGEVDLMVAAGQFIETVGSARFVGTSRQLRAIEPSPQRINGRFPINYTYAGQRHPSGVEFTTEGFPNFRPYARAEVVIPNLSGEYSRDARLANEAAGFPVVPRGYVWHHVEDGVTMQLIPENLHASVRHTGGSAVIQSKN